jgi:hypothetical protein
MSVIESISSGSYLSKQVPESEIPLYMIVLAEREMNNTAKRRKRAVSLLEKFAQKRCMSYIEWVQWYVCEQDSFVKLLLDNTLQSSQLLLQKQKVATPEELDEMKIQYHSDVIYNLELEKRFRQEAEIFISKGGRLSQDELNTAKILYEKETHKEFILHGNRLRVWDAAKKFILLRQERDEEIPEDLESRIALRDEDIRRDDSPVGENQSNNPRRRNFPPGGIE